MNQKTIYLLDDEPDLVELLSDVVDMVGLHPEAYTRAEDLFGHVEVFDDNSVLILDLHMPGMDGIEVMRRLARLENSPALILISGMDSGLLHSAEKLGRAHNLEIIASMSKPLPIDHFEQLLKSLVEDNIKSKQYGLQKQDLNLDARELRRAIDNNQLIMHYQPQLNIVTGTLVGVEALVRWCHPEKGVIFPDDFITLAEKNGLMGDLTHCVIDKTIHQKKQWDNADFAVSISVNISADDITSLTLPEQMTQLLSSSCLDPTQITLEITESVLMGELVTSLDILTRLRLKGINLSIDDFGTGYSSLSQLHRVPFTELKIDRSFVSNLPSDSEARSIVKTCIILGHELGMKIVAEGIEDKETWDLLAGFGCDIAQGYFISKPIPGEDVINWAKNFIAPPCAT